MSDADRQEGFFDKVCACGRTSVGVVDLHAELAFKRGFCRVVDFLHFGCVGVDVFVLHADTVLSARGNALDIVDVINALFFQDFKDFVLLSSLIYSERLAL